MSVAGVDGCRGGWSYVVATPLAEERLRVETIGVVASFEELIEATKICRAVAVDIPIGLSEDGLRAADFEARRRIGPRRSSVFPPPARCILDAPGGYAELNALSKQVCGRGISRQTFNILPKIREADACATAQLQERLVESHPEVAFWSLNADQCLPEAKRKPAGRALRLRLLESLYGASIAEQTPPRGAAHDDLYDAAVLARTAARLAAGHALRLPAQPPQDARGLCMEIVY